MTQVDTESPLPRGDIRRDPAMLRFLARVPDEVASTFTDEQLFQIRNAIGARQWGRHALDIRGTFSLPLIPWRGYFVVLAGRNRRALSEREQHISAFMVAAMLMLFIAFCVLLGLLVLYLIKSAAGIDLFPGFSLGIWSWFRAEFLL